MTNEDLLVIKCIAQANKDTNWEKIENGLVCSLREVIVIVLTPKAAESLVTELLDARARLKSIPAALELAKEE